MRFENPSQEKQPVRITTEEFDDIRSTPGALVETENFQTKLENLE